MEPKQARLRSYINKCLRGDSDFDAFCIDYFPEIHARFSNGMDRLQKTNILLQLADLQTLEMRLLNVMNMRSGAGSISTQQGRTPLTYKHMWRKLVWFSTLIAISSFALFVLIPWSNMQIDRNQKVIEITSCNGIGADPQDPGIFRLQLNTNPSGARVILLRVGGEMDLGIAPVNLPLGRPRSGMVRLMIRMVGYKDQIVEVPIRNLDNCVRREIDLLR